MRDMVGPSIPDGIPLDLAQFSAVLDRYYELRGWNPETGWPTRARLEALGLGDVADDVALLYLARGGVYLADGLLIDLRKT